MTDFNLICMGLSNAVYGGTREESIPTGWDQLAVDVTLSDGTHVKTEGDYYVCLTSGLEAAVYRDASGNIVLAYRGTDSLLDMLGSNLSGIILGLVNGQKGDAEDFFKAVVKQYCTASATGNVTVDGVAYDTSNLVITGHSLGGALADIVATEYGVTAYTYNAPGVTASGNSSKVTNYVVMNDFVGNLGTHVGTTYYIAPIPIEDNPLTDAHSIILNYTSTTIPALNSLSNFTQDEAWALWYYDINNGYDPLDPMLNTVRAYIATQVNENVLKNAVNVVEQTFGETSLLKNTLHYSTLHGDIIIDTSGSDTLTGTTPGLLTTGNDTIYGNKGADVINGLGGADVLYGGDGSDTYNFDSSKSFDGTKIIDSDGKGKVVLDGETLKGGNLVKGAKDLSFTDGTNTYKMVGNDLKINDSLTIKDFHNGDNKITSIFSYKLYKKSA